MANCRMRWHCLLVPYTAPPVKNFFCLSLEIFMLLKPSLVSPVTSHSLVPLTKDLTAGMLRLNNTIIFSKVASTLLCEAVIFHFTSCTQCIACSCSFEHPVPRKRDAQRVTPCATPPVPPPPPRSAEWSQGTTRAKQGGCSTGTAPLCLSTTLSSKLKGK